MKIIEKTLILNTSFGTGRYVARCFGPIICIPEHFEKNLLAHELQHAKDWRARPFTSPFMYLFNWRFRLWMELRGYYLNENMNNKRITELINTKYNIKNKIKEKDLPYLFSICYKNWNIFKKIIDDYFNSCDWEVHT